MRTEILYIFAITKIMSQLDGEVDLGVGDHSQVATTLPFNEDQPMVNFGEAESSAISVSFKPPERAYSRLLNFHIPAW